MRRAAWFVLLAFGVLACRSGSDQPGARAEDKKGTVVEIDGLRSQAPAGWKEQEISEISRQGGRLMHFRLPKADDDKMDADLFVFYFQGSGGSNDDNIKRYKSMFIPPEGKKIDDVTQVETLKVGEVPVTYVDIQGTYKFKRRPFDPNEKPELRPDSRMIAVIFESKKGPYYFRLVGPGKTVGQHKKEFDDWLKAFK
jgi:hypothetical protein